VRSLSIAGYADLKSAKTVWVPASCCWSPLRHNSCENWRLFSLGTDALATNSTGASV